MPSSGSSRAGTEPRSRIAGNSSRLVKKPKEGVCIPLIPHPSKNASGFLCGACCPEGSDSIPQVCPGHGNHFGRGCSGRSQDSKVTQLK